MSDVPRSLQSWVSTIQTVVLTADVFQFLVKFIRFYFCFFGSLKSRHAKNYPSLRYISYNNNILWSTIVSLLDRRKRIKSGPSTSWLLGRHASTEKNKNKKRTKKVKLEKNNSWLCRGMDGTSAVRFVYHDVVYFFNSSPECFKSLKLLLIVSDWLVVCDISRIYTGTRLLIVTTLLTTLLVTHH